MQSSELEDTIRQREEMIRLLEEEVRKLQQGVNDMSSELKAKGKEVLKIRSEVTKASKYVSIHYLTVVHCMYKRLQCYSFWHIYFAITFLQGP